VLSFFTVAKSSVSGKDFGWERTNFNLAGSEIPIFTASVRDFDANVKSAKTGGQLI
jgi:hypothetical protein